MLDEATYRTTIAGCTKCDRKAFEGSTYLPREQFVMLAEPTQDGRWTHDDAALIAGIYKIRCLGCGDLAFVRDDCPHCERVGGLATAIAATPRLPVPKMCPS